MHAFYLLDEGFHLSVVGLIEGNLRELIEELICIALEGDLFLVLWLHF